jgi:hypothetical protein
MSNEGEIFDTANNSTAATIPITITIQYKIKCNNRYIDISGFVINNSLEKTADITESSSNERTIIDLKRKQILYLNEKKVDTIYEYTINTNKYADSCFNYSLTNVKSFYKIKSCKTLYKNISPGVVIKGVKFGIEQVNMKGVNIILKSYSKIKWSPDFEKEFKKYETVQKGTYSFFPDK